MGDSSYQQHRQTTTKRSTIAIGQHWVRQKRIHLTERQSEGAITTVLAGATMFICWFYFFIKMALLICVTIMCLRSASAGS